MRVDKEVAMKIANDDARLYYRDLSIYKINIQLVENHWKIDYELKNKESQGGGPHYMVSAETGEILSKYFEQ